MNEEKIYPNAEVEAQTYFEDHIVIGTEEGITNEPVERDKTEP